MKTAQKHLPGPRLAAAIVRQRIERGGERVWRLDDFRDLPFGAVAKELSRLARKGVIERLSKGTYYAARATSLGKSRPNPAVVQRLVSKTKTMYPSGIAAASLLGFTTQVGRRGEVSTSQLSLPRKLIGLDTKLHTRRPEAWSGLSQVDAALLEFLRDRGKTSELPPAKTVDRTIALLSERRRYHRLMAVAGTEPPRVRALLGALGEALGRPKGELDRLRTSLNPSSRFDFGVFSVMPNAEAWQARKRGTHAAL